MNSKGYTYGTHVFPHDFRARELGTGVSRQETAAKLGLRGKIARRLDVADGIEAVRTALPRCWFDRERCFNGIEALRAYRTEFDDKRRIFKANPLHDWCSDHADSMRYFMIEMAKGGNIWGGDKDYSRINQQFGYTAHKLNKLDSTGYVRGEK
jgi:hypothetical protein